MHYSVVDALECMMAGGLIAPHDVAVANEGLHHVCMRASPSGASAACSRGGGVATTLNTHVQALLAWLTATRADARPCVVWRETLPQHFPTADGTFEQLTECPHQQRHEQPSASLPLPPGSAGLHQKAREHQPADHASCKPMPSGVRSQAFNDEVTPLVAAAGVPLARVFEPLRALWADHGGCPSASKGGQSGGAYFLDCTHQRAGTRSLHVALCRVLTSRCLHREPWAALVCGSSRTNNTAQVGASALSAR